MKTRRAIVFGTALLAGACASSAARSSVTVPLETPEPPPRVAMDPVPAVITGTAVTPERPSAAPLPRPAGPPPAASTVAASPPAAPALPVPAVVAPEPPRTTPPPELRAGGPSGRTPTAAQVRDRLVRTKQKLDSIDGRRLNTGKRIDYDSARRFLAQAEEAVRDNNLLLAESSGEKAETLADGLK